MSVKEKTRVETTHLNSEVWGNWYFVGQCSNFPPGHQFGPGEFTTSEAAQLGAICRGWTVGVPHRLTGTVYLGPRIKRRGTSSF